MVNPMTVANSKAFEVLNVGSLLFEEGQSLFIDLADGYRLNLYLSFTEGTELANVSPPDDKNYIDVYIFNKKSEKTPVSVSKLHIISNYYLDLLVENKATKTLVTYSLLKEFKHD